VIIAGTSAIQGSRDAHLYRVIFGDDVTMQYVMTPTTRQDPACANDLGGHYRDLAAGVAPRALRQ
jgi:hypothetical protein